MIYVGSAEDTRYDQVLEEVDVGPIPIGVNKFVLTAGTCKRERHTENIHAYIQVDRWVVWGGYLL